MIQYVEIWTLCIRTMHNNVHNFSLVICSLKMAVYIWAETCCRKTLQVLRRFGWRLLPLLLHEGGISFPQSSQPAPTQTLPQKCLPDDQVSRLDWAISGSFVIAVMYSSPGWFVKPKWCSGLERNSGTHFKPISLWIVPIMQSKCTA